MKRKLEVEFGGYSSGLLACKIGVKCSRSSMSLEQADEMLCGKRLNVTLAINTKGDDARQKRIKTDSGGVVEVEGVCDVKSFRVGPNGYSFGLTFNRENVDGRLLQDFPKASGQMHIDGVEDIPEEKSDDEDSEDDDSQGKLFEGAKPKRRQGAGV